ncbi:MAG: hypothetical protein J0H98_03570 [Solirubrobacterales bacterium]|nr:hypothetical protein [Solirubrobacterales bacterium]
MPVSHERSAWSDERLDDLARFTRDGFANVDRRFAQIDQRLTQMDQRLDRMEDRIAALQRTLVIGMFGLSGTLLATVLAIVLKGG